MLEATWLVILLLLPLCDCGSLSGGGYFLKLLEIPAVCPLASFCTPWRPRDVSE